MDDDLRTWLEMIEENTHRTRQATTFLAVVAGIGLVLGVLLAAM